MAINLREFAGPPPSADTALLERALTHWADKDAFSDADVGTVCAVFRSVFKMAHTLQGATVRDALLLYPVEDEGKDTMRIYAMQVKEEGPHEFRWVYWELSSMWSFGTDAYLDDMLTVLTMSGRLVE